MARREYDSREITIALERALIDDFGETAFAILANLIFASPVGNPSLWQNPTPPPGYVGGHFRRNWIVSIGGFDDTEIDDIDPSGANTLAEGLAEIRHYQGIGEPGVNLVIQNNVPYANRLALGHSLQAPDGWVDEAIDEGLGEPTGEMVLD